MGYELWAMGQTQSAECQAPDASRGARSAKRQSGFTYLTILFVVAFMGVGMAYVGEAWYSKTMREREAELLFVGNQYRKAIERYYRNGPAQYPRALTDLIKDPRKPNIERYLRRAYADPITGKDEWGILKAPDGGVMGIYSLSEAKPFKKTNFRLLDRDFENASRYADWKFVYQPLGPAATPQPGVQPVPGVPGTPGPGQTTPGTGPVQAVPGSATPGGTIAPSPLSPAPGTTSAPFTTQAVPQSATTGGTVSSPFSSSSPGGPMSTSPTAPNPTAPGLLQTQPFLSTQPEPSSTTAR